MSATLNKSVSTAVAMLAASDPTTTRPRNRQTRARPNILEIFDKLSDGVFLNIIETAALLDMHPQTLKTWVGEGKGPPSVKIHGRRKYQVGALRKWSRDLSNVA